MENNQANKKLAEKKKQRRKVITWIVMVLIVVMLAVMPIAAAKNNAEQEQTASILSGTVEYGSIDRQIVGGGLLASEASVKLEIPEEVKLTEYLVGNGDTVKAGEPVARVDRVSVMTAITGVQEALDELSADILDAEDDQPETAVKAKVGGTVKIIYAQVGESAQDVMLRHGALAAISLDDIMAVKIYCQSQLDAGDSVLLAFPDGTEAEGRVEQNLEGTLTITVEDEDYPVGAQVTVLTEDRAPLGVGNLYIFNQWNATAYSGTVSNILVKEGASLYSGQTLIKLENPGHTAEFQRLIDKRQEYEQLMQELFQMYRTETITAPCDGIVSGVDKNGAFLLSGSGDGFVLELLSNLVNVKRDMFVAHGVCVEAVTAAGMQMQINARQSWVEDMADLSSVSADPKKMNETWDYTGDTTVYVQSEDGLLHADGTAQPGDILLAVGDAENLLWFVRADASQGRQEEQEGSVQIDLLSSKTPDIYLDLIIERQWIAKEPGEAELKATQGAAVLDGDWYIESSDFELTVSEAIVSGTPKTAGVYEFTVIFDPEDSDELVKKTFEITVAEPYEIVTKELPAGVVGVPYSFKLEVSGSTGGKWSAENLLPLALNEDTGEISGVPVMAGTIQVKVIYMDASGKQPLTKEFALVISATQAPGFNASGGGIPGGGMSGGFSGGMTGGFSGGMMPGGTTQEEESYYSLEKLTIASVTSQEHMTVEITIDELDISRIYVGQSATVTMDALAGESFAATVTKIANSGENEGGNSKFMVELTLEKNGDMLPGMTASARIVLEEIENILCIPAAALSKVNGKTVVYTSYDAENGVLGAPEEITIGIADANNVQVLSGLDEGETFYYAYYDTLETAEMMPMGAPPFG